MRNESGKNQLYNESEQDRRKKSMGGIRSGRTSENPSAENDNLPGTNIRYNKSSEADDYWSGSEF